MTDMIIEPRELLILRHGKSDWTHQTPDFDRPLNSRGKRNAKQIGQWLQQHDLEPDRIVSSPALRAATTTQRVAKELTEPGSIKLDPRIYEASLNSLLYLLGEADLYGDRVLLVGHNPGLDALLEYLAGQHAPRTADGKLMTTATLAQLIMPTDWADLKPSSASLVQLIRAKALTQ
ncbi:MAG: histidine phosphatase family protein [Methylococcaceae bacterium]